MIRKKTQIFCHYLRRLIQSGTNWFVRQKQAAQKADKYKIILTASIVVLLILSAAAAGWGENRLNKPVTILLLPATPSAITTTAPMATATPKLTATPMLTVVAIQQPAEAIVPTAVATATPQPTAASVPATITSRPTATPAPATATPQPAASPVPTKMVTATPLPTATTAPLAEAAATPPITATPALTVTVTEIKEDNASATQTAFPGIEQTVTDLWTFPLKIETRTPSQGVFGARRSGSRLHAGIDLYGADGTKVYAMAAGRVSKIYIFYEALLAIEVVNDDGTIIRYTELTPLVSVGDRVEQGQAIARLKKNSSGTCMLHLEIYATAGSGLLTQKDNNKYLYVTAKSGSFMRRSDLVDPSAVYQLPRP